MVVEDLYEAARRSNTDEEAAESLGINVSDFVRLCTISGIESPGQRRKRLEKARGKGPSPLFRPAGADRVVQAIGIGLQADGEGQGAESLDETSGPGVTEEMGLKCPVTELAHPGLGCLVRAHGDLDRNVT